jgi:hypothetical protein
MISETEALSRIEPEQLNQLLRPVFDLDEKRIIIGKGNLLAKGLKEYEISLYDKNKPKRRGISTSGKKPTVVVADARKEEKRTQGKKSVEKVESDEGKYRIIDTPFGKIKRRIK